MFQLLGVLIWIGFVDAANSAYGTDDDAAPVAGGNGFALATVALMFDCLAGTY